MSVIYGQICKQSLLYIAEELITKMIVGRPKWREMEGGLEWGGERKIILGYHGADTFHPCPRPRQELKYSRGQNNFPPFSISQSKWSKSKQQPSWNSCRHQFCCCLIFLCFLCDIHEHLSVVTLSSKILTWWKVTMPKRKWRETKLQPSRARVASQPCSEFAEVTSV